MSFNEDIERIYARIIDETISRVGMLQSAAVMDQLRIKWAAKVRDRLEASRQRDRRVREETSRHQSSRDASIRMGRATGAPSVYIPNFEGVTVAPSVPTKRRTLAGLHRIVPPAKKPKIDETSPLDALVGSGAGVEEMRAGGDEFSSRTVVEFPSLSPTTNSSEIVKEEPADEEDEWGEWTSPAPSEDVSLGGGNADIKFEDGRTADMHTVDVKDESDLDDMSDLDDEDPKYSDLIVAQFETVQRPHARKSSQRGLWRIKLRNGLLQINGIELLFNSLSGEFDF